MAQNEILVFQYHYILRNRNGRLVLSIGLFICAAYLFLLVTRSQNQINITYNASNDPVSIKLTKLEGKVDSFLSFFTELLHYKNERKNERIISSFRSSAMDSFWYDINKTESSRNFDKQIFNQSISFSNHTSKLISTTSCEKNIPVLILILSHPKGFNRRRIIRKTWGSVMMTSQKAQWQTFFLLGKQSSELLLSQITQEHKQYKDLIFGNVEEDIDLAVKKIHMGFEWAVKYCDFKYLIKSDDRAFVNTRALFKHLNDKETPKTELYFGNVQYETKVMRDGQDSLSRTEYSKVVFPRYCASGGYVLSKDSVEKMLPLFLTTAPLRFDDIYVGILALKSGIDPVHNGEFQMFRDEKKCEYNRHGIILHPVIREDCMMDLFKESLKKIY